MTLETFLNEQEIANLTTKKFLSFIRPTSLIHEGFYIQNGKTYQLKIIEEAPLNELEPEPSSYQELISRYPKISTNSGFSKISIEKHSKEDLHPLELKRGTEPKMTKKERKHFLNDYNWH